MMIDVMKRPEFVQGELDQVTEKKILTEIELIRNFKVHVQTEPD